jgi:cytolysin-activating lysine-acyltransferase
MAKSSRAKANGAATSADVPVEQQVSTSTLAEKPHAKIAEIREKIHLSVGQIVLLMANSPRYRSQTLADLSHLVLEPLLRDRIAIATVRTKDIETSTSAETLAGVAIWASVSDVVDAKIREQIGGGSFPIRLGTDDWVSGDRLWLLDVVAADKKLATAVLANFSQVAGDRPVSIHPIVGRSVDAALLETLRVSKGGK